MPAEITAVTPRSPAARTKIAPGDVLLSINGHAIGDILDYRFYAAARRLALTLRRGSREYTLRLRKGEYDDLGLEFANGLMDDQRRCKNKCVFCFIDQLPPDLRESLYIKDDDARLGFLFGKYITLTNLTGREAARIIEMRLSPINVSVHTMNPELRCKMMGNPNAGGSLAYLGAFAQAELDLNIQLVLCPGWNDGEELRFTLRELLKLPTVKSIAAVPVGLTKYRENLTPLRPFTREEARRVIEIFEEFRSVAPPGPAATSPLASEGGLELCCSDEFFLIAQREMPGVEYYGEFRQIENGVGLWASLRQEMLDLLWRDGYDDYDPARADGLTLRATIATGTATAPLLRFLVDEMKKIWHNIHVNVRAIDNRFFGEQVTVAGLLTGQDIIEQLRNDDLGEVLLLPCACFSRLVEGQTLDGMTEGDIARALGVPVIGVGGSAQVLLDTLIGGDWKQGSFLP